jgi:dTDP-4-amino-4,6-dideoxygalactose transaminase
MFANHGRIDKYDHELEGVNSRLDGLQAAILQVKLRRLPEWTERRRRNALLYHQHLSGLPVVTPTEAQNVRAVYHLYVVRVEPGLREGLRSYLQGHGISTGIHYPIALPNLKAYEYMSTGRDDCRVATKASGEILSLPMFPELEEAEILYIADKIRKFFAGGRR